ncbi:response regulator transcription factor [Cereibacter sp. SYSU M97828]|nr:response regulator transcription factor [Cereibacter flavus]
MTRILIVEDDPDIASLLQRGLGAEGYATLWEAGVDEALARLATDPCDAAIVDMMLDDDRGTRLLEEMRLRGHDIPAIVLSALNRVEDRTEGLDAGAGDYIVKPFQMAELVARLRVQLKRAAPRDPVLQLGGLRFDPASRSVMGERRIVLTEREADLLTFLMHNPGRVLTRGEIFDRLWAPHGGSTENVVDVYLGYLRRKLPPLSTFGLALRTLRGRGFVLTREDA